VRDLPELFEELVELDLARVTGSDDADEPRPSLVDVC
jgi:hypothetical protein